MAKSKPTGIRFSERAAFAKEKLGITGNQKLVDYFVDNFWFSHNPIPLGEINPIKEISVAKKAEEKRAEPKVELGSDDLIWEKIDEIENEKRPSHITATWAIDIYKKGKAKRISDLKKQLKQK